MIIGIDEVGRGCWAGPVVAAAVGLEPGTLVEGLNDSKLLSATSRLKLVPQIQGTTQQIGIGWVWPREINKVGLTESVRLAMQRAIDQLTQPATEIIIDGSYNFLAHIPNTVPIVKADGSVSAVSAASVVAKVARDAYMIKIAKKYPGYGFESHVGYGTKKHRDALAKHGVLPIHRMNYKPIQQFLVGSS